MLSSSRAALFAVLGMLLLAAPRHAGAGGIAIRDHLYCVAAGDAQRFWAAGAFGTILHSADGGITWHAQKSNTDEQLFGIGFADAANGWAVGRSGTILHTRDGGATWSKQPAGTEHHLFDVAALAPQVAVAIGDWGTILRTDDGGATWVDRSYSRDVILNDQSWIGLEKGWIVGETGVVLATADGGATWTEQGSGLDKTLFGVHFRDARHGWATGLDGLIVRTVDGGLTWEVQHGVAAVESFDDYSFAETLGNPAIYDISFAGDHGWAVGDLGALFFTRDGGRTWARREATKESQLQWIRGLSLAAGGGGVFVGARGLIGVVRGDELLKESGGHAP